MANNIFERFGIKEVANVYFEALKDNNDMGYSKGDIVLYLDTLKVSTVETTAENVSAQGGWGNPKLVTWDYGKDINITLEDAVISWEEMRILLGAEQKTHSDNAPITIRKTAEKNYGYNVTPTWPKDGDGLVDDYGKHNFCPVSIAAGLGTADSPAIRYMDLTTGQRGYAVVSAEGGLTFYKRVSEGSEVTYVSQELIDTEDKEDRRIRFFWEDKTTSDAKNAVELVISPSRFPDTYRVIGDALIRSEKDNMDEAFQFVIEKAKLLSEVTLTMQAEGDPSTFNMTLNVLRDPYGNMMKLIKY